MVWVTYCPSCPVIMSQQLTIPASLWKWQATAKFYSGQSEESELFVLIAVAIFSTQHPLCFLSKSKGKIKAPFMTEWVQPVSWQSIYVVQTTKTLPLCSLDEQNAVTSSSPHDIFQSVKDFCALYLTCTTVMNDLSGCSFRQWLTLCLMLLHMTKPVPPHLNAVQKTFMTRLLQLLQFATTMYWTSRKTGTK